MPRFFKQTRLRPHLIKQGASHGLALLSLSTMALLLSYTDPKGIRAWLTVRSEHQKVSQEILSLKDKLSALSSEISAFESDPIYQEQLVRIQTGYLKSNEVMIEWL